MVKLHKAIIFAVIFVLTSGLMAQSLLIEDSIAISANTINYDNSSPIRLGIGGCYLSPDLTLVSIRSGLIGRLKKDSNWDVLIACSPRSNDWWDDYQGAISDNNMYWPGEIYKIPGDNQFIVFDKYIHAPYGLMVSTDIASAVLLNVLDSISIINDIEVSGENIFYAVYSSKHDTVFERSDINGESKKGIFALPKNAANFLNSVSADKSARITENWVDSTVWLVPEYYNVIYHVDWDGRLLDSICITNDEFRLPNPPKSRIMSPSVYEDWSKNCTDVHKIEFAYPEYLVMQFWGNWEAAEKDSVRLSPTLIWKTDGTPIKLEINKTWRLVQAQSDGRIVFARYSHTNGIIDKAVIYITRINP